LFGPLIRGWTAEMLQNKDWTVNVVGGLIARKSLAEMDAEFFEAAMQLNVTSCFFSSKYVMP